LPYRHPAIWANPDKPAESLVIGTDKKGGLNVYDMARSSSSCPTGR